jgi:hypothetical protein
MQLVDANDDIINTGIIEAAKAGDPAARVAYLKYLRPRVRLNPTPVTVERPETIEQVRAVCAELAVKSLAGALDLDAAQVAAGLLRSVEASIVSHDLAELLERLKAEAKQ